MAACFLGFFAATALAADSNAKTPAATPAPVESKPILATPGKLLFEDDFAREEMAPKWSIGKGFWTIHEGVVTVAENPDDHHGAYAYVKQKMEFKDIVAEFSFKFDNSGRLICSLMMEDSKYKGSHAGHIIRASVYSGQTEMVDMKTGGMKNEYVEKMKDPKTTDAEKKALRESIKDTRAEYQLMFEKNQWHQARVEVVGDEMLLSIDGKPAGYLKSPGVDHPTKNELGFTVNNKTCQLKGLKVWEASASPDWSAKRAEVIASLQKK